jgi:hypothetical protein
MGRGVIVPIPCYYVSMKSYSILRKDSWILVCYRENIPVCESLDWTKYFLDGDRD